MFDIGFAELVIIGVVGLLVIGPERLPSTIRTTQLWIRRLKGNFDEIKRELERDLHNDEIMQQLRETKQEITESTSAVSDNIGELKSTLEQAVESDFLDPIQHQTDAGRAIEKPKPDPDSTPAENSDSSTQKPDPS